MAPKILAEPNKLWWFLPAAAAIALLYLLSPILAPFLFAAMLAYISNPTVNWLARHRVGRPLGAVLVMLFLGGVLVLLFLILLPLFIKEVALLSERLPGLLAQLNEDLVPWVKAKFDVDMQFDLAAIKKLIHQNLQGADGLGLKLLASLKIGGLAVLGFVVNLLLVPVVLFYLLRDWNALLARISRLLPRRWHAQVTTIASEIDAVLAEFLRGQIAVMLLMSVFYVLGLWLAGLEFALPIGIITGMLVFVPYVGMLTGLVLATLVALMQFPSVSGVVPVWLAFGIGQALEGMLVTPLLVGQRIGLHPVAVIFALLAFGQIFGFFGILLALPASAALLVGLRHLGREYLNSSLYKN
ncbi:MAG: AI-2E family transporter [Burkholderiales bacterium]|nr:AI-2E family transporter [Burkholderiales bacterium]